MSNSGAQNTTASVRVVRRKGVLRLRALVPFGLLALLLVGCSDRSTPQNIFDPKGSQAEKINNLQVPVFIIAGVVGVLVMGAVAIILFQFRAKKHPDDEVPTQIHGNSKLEIVWTIMPGVLLLLVAVPTVATVFDLAQKPSNALVVDVVGQQWWWEFDYPDSRHRHGERDGDPGRTERAGAHQLA